LTAPPSQGDCQFRGPEGQLVLRRATDRFRLGKPTFARICGNGEDAP
jgi:hypothetical protein